MPFDGYLVKVTSAATPYVIPLKYMEPQTYQAPLITQDAEPLQTASGKLNRNVVKHQVIKVSFETIAGITNHELDKIMSGIRRGFSAEGWKRDVEKKLKIKAYIPEINDYKEMDVYLKPDMEITIDTIDDVTNTVTYEPISFVFTGY